MSLDESVIRSRIESCPRLGSLRKINSTFQDLANADRDYTGQIAEIIRRDPSLTSRLLQMVNSVFYGLSNTVNSVEDAVFYLGTKQIKQLALATPVLEDMQKFTEKAPDMDWVSFWQQSIGCAIMTRELLSFTNVEAKGDADYISGLVFGVGYLVAIYAFPDQMKEIYQQKPETEKAFRDLQMELVGWDHSEVGAYYMESHGIPSDIRMPVMHQLNPEEAGDYKHFSSAIYVAKRMVSEFISNQSADQNKDESKERAPQKTFNIPLPNTPAWHLCPELHFLLSNEGNPEFSVSSLRYSLSHLPDMLKGLV